LPSIKAYRELSTGLSRNTNKGESMPHQSKIPEPDNTKKSWLKFIKQIDNPFLIEAIINEAESRRRQLNPIFKSQTSEG